MLFNTAQYGIFFTIVLIVHWILPQRLRRTFILLASYYFYMSAIPQYIALILALTIFTYSMALFLHRASGGLRKLLLWFTIAGDLGTLAYFKYSGLLLKSVQQMLSYIPHLHQLSSDPLVLNVLLPLGISFFTFEFIHYVVEVYKGFTPMRNPVDFALFAAFFPTQIAGPIKRFPDFAKQLQHPLSLKDIDFDSGLALILKGLVKKIIVADTLSTFVTQTFSHPSVLGPGTAWIAVFAFAIQILCDFSGYTDIGRGSAALLGYSVPENFTVPYASQNPSVFWHNWHITLSTWLRDYLYIPLGGSRVAKPFIYLNLMITMALGGLWHGASWHFMVWGIYQGILLCLHKLWKETVGTTIFYKKLAGIKIYDFLARMFTFVFVCFGWIFFRADNVTSAFQMFKSMITIWHGHWLTNLPVSLSSKTMLLIWGALIVVMWGWIWPTIKEPVLQFFNKRIRFMRKMEQESFYAVVFRPVAFVIAACLILLWPSPVIVKFIYFQF